ncbi:hypothetical protein KSP39_PZI017393 [Platanthera zijinensis]|uniref:Selenoprotein H n=1 Tax=Platanthera zijinensis TaxID=2320716 RepID=A0AAP0B535_9ASPA
MAPKRKSEATVARRSVRSTAAPKTTPTTPQKEASAVKKVKVAGDDKAKPNEDEVELFSPRPRAVPSKKENDGDGKVKPREKKVVGASSAAGKKARSAVDKVKSVGNGATEEPKTVKEGIKHGKIDVAEDEGLQASLSTAPSVLRRTIIVEACTQCKSFKERAEKVKKGLESAVPGITVKINPQKPRRGYFEITEERTEVILSLPNMKRPFEPMKKLNMDELVGDLVKRFE